MIKKIAFISAPISKFNNSDRMRQYCKNVFMRTQLELEAQGYSVFNPITLADVFGWDKSHSFYMSICFIALRECDIVFFLEGWNESEGCKLEMGLAEATNKDIRYLYYNEDVSQTC